MKAIFKLFIGLFIITFLMLFGLVGCTYKVESYEDWIKLADRKVEASNYDKIVLESDIDFEGKEFKPAYVDNVPFDGQGYALKNISYTSSDSGFVLLETRDGITVSNLNIENINLDIQKEGANVFIFGIQVNRFENVIVNGTINAPNAESIGGFTFQHSNPASACTFVNCVSDLTINGGKVAGGFLAYARAAYFEYCENKSNITASNTAGGFIGESREDCENDRYVAKREIKMTNCTNSGVITSMGTAAGFIATGNKCIIADCVNNGEIKGVRGIGGFVGSLTGEISNSVNNAKISAIASASDNVANVGGIVGVLNEKSTISFCTNNGEIYNPYCVSGGIVANGYGDIDSCKNNALVTAQACAGGIVGVVCDEFNPWNVTSTVIKITNCTNSGDVRGTLFCGGIVGLADLNKVDKQTLTLSGYITTYVQYGFDAIEYGYKTASKLLYGEDVSMYRFTDEEIRDFINGILKHFTHATKLQLQSCKSTGKISATNFAGGYVGIMFSCMVDGEKFLTNSFTGIIDCEGVKSDGCTYVKVSDITDLK